jgi:DNA polymerase-1
MEKLVLIDGNAIVHRAYHALPKTMTTRKGEQTNAVYGFTTALIRVLEDLKPDYLAASFDLAGLTFRHEAYKEYKATRVKADQELYDQIPRVKELLETMEIPIYEKEGYEADDCLGTIVAKMSKSKIQNPNEIQNLKSKKSNPANPASEANQLDIYVVSGDKDIFQLIDGNIKVYNLRRGLSDTQIVDRESIEKEYHLQPEDFIDLKALAGDPSDNIPGVPGIGPKTATTLLQDFDSLRGLYDKIGDAAKPFEQNFQFSLPRRQAGIFNFQSIPNESIFKQISEKLNIKERILRLLIENKDQAFMSQHLATIHRDVPIDFSLEEARFGEYDRDKLKELFEKLGFVSLLRRFGIIDEKSDRKITEEQKKKDSQLKLL